jgi:hypothetical protein
MIMRSFSQLARQTGRVLSAQARRLRANLEDLARQVRDAVARTVSQSVAEATRDALQLVLEGPTEASGAWPSSYDNYQRSWDDVHDRPGRWSSGSPARDYGSLDPDDWPDEYDQNGTSNAEDVADKRRPRRWARALKVGCQAAAWWLRRHPGRFSSVVATCIGVAAGLVALLANPVLVSAGTAAATALSVLALADAARPTAHLATAWW